MGRLSGVRDLGLVARQCAATVRLTRDFGQFARNTLDAESAAGLIASRLARRDREFLERARRTVFSRAASPHARLLRWAGCGPGELAELVRTEGIEGALGVLADRGVYLTYDESKGEREIVRGSLRFTTRPSALVNPECRTHLIVFTSGSYGDPTPIGRSLDDRTQSAASFSVAARAHGIHDPVHAVWISGPNYALGYAPLGQRVIGWFNPTASLSLATRVGQRYIAALARYHGVAVAQPSSMTIDRPGAMVEWLASQLRRHPSVCVTTVTSNAVRASEEAARRGISLAGVTWIGFGESVTRTRRERIAASGARLLNWYGITEIGGIGLGCADEGATDAVHVLMDRVAVVRHSRMNEHGPRTALLYTTLASSMSTVAFNTEFGDDGDLDDGGCTCGMRSVGYTQRLSGLHSFEKLNAGGVTLVSSNLRELVEQSLPATFGGATGDFQLADVERTDGRASLVLRVHPRIGAIDDDRARALVLAAIGGRSEFRRYMAATLSAADAVVIERAPPTVLPNGKTPVIVPLLKK